jgi:tetratricopeptide (TPR) repeat protein
MAVHKHLVFLLVGVGFVPVTTVAAAQPDATVVVADEWVGKQVMAKSPDVRLHDRPDETSPAIDYSLHGILLTVERTEQGWLDLTQGWAPAADLVRVDQAVEHSTAQLAQGESVFAYLGRARGWLERGEVDRASADVSEALRLDSQNARAFLVRAKIAGSQGRNEDALADYDRAVQLDPRDPLAVAVRANVWGSRGDYDRAIADLSAAIALMPSDVRLWGQRGWCYASKGDYDRALSDFSEAIRVNPRQAFPYSRRAAMYLRRQEYEKALADAEQAVRLDPKIAHGYAVRGEALAAQGKLDDALRDLDKSVRLDARDSYVFNQRGLVHVRKRDYDAALLDFTQAIALKPDDAFAYYQRAGMWLFKHDQANALVDLGEYLRLKPDAADAWVTRGYLRLQSSEDEALQDFNEALRFNPRHVGALVGKSLVWQQRDDTEKALESLAAALEIAPDNTQIYQQRARLWSSQQKWGEAAADLNQVIRLKPEDAAVFCQRGKCWIELKQYDKALHDADEALRIDPKSEEAAEIRWEAEKAQNGGRAALDDSHWIGREVLPRRAEVTFYQGDGVTVQAAAAGILVVNFADGDTICVEQGCVEKRQLIPLEQAEEYFTKRIQHVPTAFAYAMRGRARADLGQADAAIADCDAALKLDVKCALAWCYRGWARSARLDFAAAVDDYTEAIRLDPKLAAAYAWRGRARQRRGQTELAIQDFDELLRLLPNDSATQRRRAFAAGEEQPRFFGTAPPRPRDGEDFYLRAMARLENQRPDDALADVNEALRLGLKTSSVYAWRASLQVKRHALSEAIADYTAALELQPTGNLYVSRGLAYGYLGEYENTASDLRQGLDLDSQALATITDGWSEEGPFQDLIKHAQERRADPDLPRAYCVRAMVWISKGEYEDAIDDLSSAIEIEPQWALAFCLRGWCGHKLEQVDDADRDLSVALRLDPAFAAAGELARTPPPSAAEDAAKWLPAAGTDAGAAPSSAQISAAGEAAGPVPGASIEDLSGDTPSDEVPVKANAEEIAAVTEALRKNPDDEDALMRRLLILSSLLERALRLYDAGQFEEAIADVNLVIAAFDKDAGAFDIHSEVFEVRGEIFAKSGDYARALDDFQQSLRLADRGDRPMIHARLAWIWATCPDARFRDGKRAVRAAKKSLRAGEQIPPDNYEALAAAYAECGEFDEAIKWQTKAIEAATAPEEYRDEVRQRLELYRAGQPYRQPAPSPGRKTP